MSSSFLKTPHLLILLALAFGFMGFSGAANALTNAPATIFHYFGNYANDSTDPESALTLSADGTTLYGTTQQGGIYRKGTVFSFNLKTGGEFNLYSFGSIGNDGSSPVTAVTLSSDGKILYGVTPSGGVYSKGAVFSINTKTGAETNLYMFGAIANDGSSPAGRLTLSADGTTLYGTTPYGGDNNGYYGDGTVFSINIKTHSETLVYDFGATTNDGYWPEAGLTPSTDGKTLYGTTSQGGVYGNGTVFACDIGTGTESILYSFGAATNDGVSPIATLTPSTDGTTLYGTTSKGGSYGFGTVFAIDIGTGEETILYTFGSSDWSDGSDPVSGLSLSADGTTLYGTTSKGGVNANGTIFGIDIATGTETIFSNGGTSANNGFNPGLGVTLSTDGKILYGTSSQGGWNYSSGILFSISLPKPLAPKLTFTKPSISVVFGTSPLSDPASSGSPGVITYKSSNTNVATVSGIGDISFVGVGTSVITATQAAVPGYLSSTKLASVKVTAAIPTIGILTLPSNATVSSGTFTITNPTSTSLGAFSYKSSNTMVATIKGNVITYLKAGTTTITATQAAKGNYSSGKVSALLTVAQNP